MPEAEDEQAAPAPAAVMLLPAPAIGGESSGVAGEGAPRWQRPEDPAMRAQLVKSSSTSTSDVEPHDRSAQLAFALSLARAMPTSRRTPKRCGTTSTQNSCTRTRSSPSFDSCCASSKMACAKTKSYSSAEPRGRSVDWSSTNRPAGTAKRCCSSSDSPPELG